MSGAAGRPPTAACRGRVDGRRDDPKDHVIQFTEGVLANEELARAEPALHAALAWEAGADRGSRSPSRGTADGRRRSGSNCATTSGSTEMLAEGGIPQGDGAAAPWLLSSRGYAVWWQTDASRGALGLTRAASRLGVTFWRWAPETHSESKAQPVARSFYPRRVHFGELTDPEQRVLGCLIEKRWTTPDQYPLSLNSLRLACNQSTNRDPVTDYDESTVRDAAQRLAHYGLARLASYHGSRATKYRHLAEEALGLDREQLAILGVLLLRGPQTPGELKGRSERMAKLDSLTDVERVLLALGDRGYVRRLSRRPGQKEDRFEQLLGGEGPAEAPAVSIPAAPPAPARSPAPHVASAPVAPSLPVREVSAERDGELAARVTALEEEVARLRAELTELLGP